MPTTRINLALAAPMLKDLDKLAAKYGFDRTNAIRYAIRRICDLELNRGAHLPPGGEEKK